MYRYLMADGILTQAENPAARAEKPRRLRSARMALPDSRLDELCRVASTRQIPWDHQIRVVADTFRPGRTPACRRTLITFHLIK